MDYLRYDSWSYGNYYRNIQVTQFFTSVTNNERKKRELIEMIYRCGTEKNAPKKAQPSEGSFDEVEPEGYASSRAGFSTWLVVRSHGVRS